MCPGISSSSATSEPPSMESLPVLTKRAKKVTDPLDDVVRESLIRSCGCSSYYSLGPSNADIDMDMDMSILMETEEQQQKSTSKSVSDTHDDTFLEQENLNILHSLLSHCRTPLASHLHEIAWNVMAGEEAERNKLVTLEYLLKKLQTMGYNAGICKTDYKTNNINVSHHFIDVIVTRRGEQKHMNERYLVEMDFKSSFEILHSTCRYKKFMGLLPCVLVGNVDAVKQIVHLMGSEMRRSLADKGMGLPPWRTQKHLEALWFSPYKRFSTTPVPIVATQLKNQQAEGGISKRSVNGKWMPPQQIPVNRRRHRFLVSALSSSLLINA